MIDLSQYKRPLFIFGWGVHLAKAEDQMRAFVAEMQIPFVCTWGAADLFSWDEPLYAGTFGTHGVRPANWAVQNADLIISVGSRLDTKATGSPASGFAPNARVIMVDIDQGEIDKFKRLGREVEGMLGDVHYFLSQVKRQHHACEAWRERIQDWKRRYPAVPKDSTADSPYQFVSYLSQLLRPDDIIVSDTGCPVGWMAQAFNFTGQRFFHAWNNTPMGWGLPAAVGAAFACPDSRIICITGDGGLGVNVTELATLARHKLNVKIILLNNRGHAMCRQTQRTWMGGTYPSTSYEGGLATPDFEAVADAYNIPVFGKVERLLDHDGMGFHQFVVDLDEQLSPQVRADQPLHNASPFIDKDELAEIMTNV